MGKFLSFPGDIDFTLQFDFHNHQFGGTKLQITAVSPSWPLVVGVAISVTYLTCKPVMVPCRWPSCMSAWTIKLCTTQWRRNGRWGRADDNDSIRTWHCQLQLPKSCVFGINPWTKYIAILLSCPMKFHLTSKSLAFHLNNTTCCTYSY